MNQTEAHAREVAIDVPAPQLGLALSGGGFRASLFHLGVLARLAERGLLRPVEVISTVSGGSIVGALYYVYLRQLLTTKADHEIADDDYVAIVMRIEETFLPALARNFRALATGSLWKNFRMASLRYSRSTRMGELYDELLYRPAWNQPLFGRPDPVLARPVELRDLMIVPPGHTEFSPKDGNAERRAKVPILLLNATTLNTGHNFRFEAVRIGEPEHNSADELDIDKNARLGRASLDSRTVTLGTAVAASACVPTVFHPVPFVDLYPGWRVELVDGGNHDNQGVQALLDRHCVHVIVSDASGQMGDVQEPSTRIPAVALRSGNAIYGDRLREEQLLGVLKVGRAAVVHLTRGLSAPTVDPPGLTVSETESSGPRAPEPGPGSAAFGVHPDVQLLLAKVRTDLDVFSEVEATALSLDGYLMTADELDRRPEIAALGTPGGTHPWRFDRREVGTLMAAPTPPYLAQLTAARAKFFRMLRVGGTPRAVATGALALPVAALAAGVIALFWFLAGVSAPLAIPIGVIVLVLLLVVAYALPEAKLPLVSPLADIAATRAGPALLAPFLWLGSQVALHVTTPWLLRLGRVDSVWKRSQGEVGTTTQAAP